MNVCLADLHVHTALSPCADDAMTPPVIVGAALTEGLGMIAVVLGLDRYGAPLSKLAPLYNLNTLVVVLLALVFYAESRDVNTMKLLGGASLIMAGAAVVARA